MNIRTTPLAMYDRQMQAMRLHSSKWAAVQEQATTGLKINRPSDDPLTTVSILASQAEDMQLEMQQNNVDMLTSQLNQSNDAVLQANRLMTRARQLALDAANSTNDSTNRKLMVNEVDRLLEQMLSTANTSVDGRYLFGGTATAKAPFVVTARDTDNRITAIAYQGSENRAFVRVGRDEQISTLYQGDQVFMRPGQNVFEQLIGLREELMNTAGMSEADLNAALTARVGGIETVQQRLLDTAGEMSSSLEALQSLKTRLGDIRTLVKSHIGDMQSADMAEVVVNLRTQETLFSNTLAVSARVFNLSLLDYLR